MTLTKGIVLTIVPNLDQTTTLGMAQAAKNYRPDGLSWGPA